MKNSKDSSTVRQNSNYSSTTKHDANLRRNPTLHFQIGLILALLASIFFIEMRMPEKAVVVPDVEVDIENVFTIDQVQVETKPKAIEKKEAQKLQAELSEIIDEVEKAEDTDPIEETVIEPTDPMDDTPMVNPGDVEVVEPIEEIVSVMLVEQVPLFPGCEGLSSNTERRDCMNTKISKFVSKRFRTDKAENLGLEGENQIYVLFTIDNQGKVKDIQARAPHQALEEEALRVTDLLPDMTPGKQGGQDVSVKMALPIKFIIQD